MSNPFTATVHGPPAEFVLDNETYEIRGPWHHLATTLMSAEWALDTLAVIVDPQDHEALLDRLLDPDDGLDTADLEPVVAQLVKRATGVDWWVAAKLLGWAVAQWQEFDGWALARGVDVLPLLEYAPARACSLIYHRLVDGADETRRARFDGELSMPPVSALASASTDEEDASAFMAALAAHGR